MPLIDSSFNSPEQAALRQIQQTTQQAMRGLLQSLNQTSTLLWKSKNPAGVLALMGTSAKDTFSANAIIVAAVAQASPLLFDKDTSAKQLEVLETVAKMAKPIVENSDGSLSLAPEPTTNAPTPSV